MSELHVTVHGPIDVGAGNAPAVSAEPLHVVSDAPAAAIPVCPRCHNSRTVITEGPTFKIFERCPACAE